MNGRALEEEANTRKSKEEVNCSEICLVCVEESRKSWVQVTKGSTVYLVFREMSAYLKLGFLAMR